ncbi:MAG TPA: hypothetical protein VNZ45_05815 [Bacteroidia bacterium]|jgi:hypothetical protein|nr:hypothetical protein [Bacteroidia bacterium]
MKVIPAANSEHLLSPSLESLHRETVEWLEDVAFWRDEVAFLYSLELKDTLKSVPVGEKTTIRKIENDLVKLTGGNLDLVENEVELHELSLEGILTNKSTNEEGYRETHNSLAAKTSRIEKHIKALKKEIFRLAKLSNQSKKDVPGFREPEHLGVQK